MRIAFLNPSGAIGGGERSLLNLISSLRAAGDPRRGRPDVQPFLIACGDGPLIRAAIRDGIPTTVIPLPPVLAGLGDSGARGKLMRGLTALAGRAIAGAPAARDYLKAIGAGLRAIAPDLIHSNGLKTHLLAAAAAPSGVPIVWHVRDYIGQRPVVAVLLKLARRRASGAIAISRSVAAGVRTALPGLPVVTVPNAINLGSFSPDPRADDQVGPTPTASNRPIRVGLVATFARWKGHDVFLRAAALLAARRPDLNVHYEVIGGPIYDTVGSQFTANELHALATELGIAERVVFTGFLPDPAAAYRALDIVVHASTLPEPFGLTIAEAMACGRAVIVANAGGATELFTDGLDAVGVPPSDPAALSRAIERLATDADVRRKLGKQARETAIRQFDRSRLGPQILRAYATFLGRSVSGRGAAATVSTC